LSPLLIVVLTFVSVVAAAGAIVAFSAAVVAPGSVLAGRLRDLGGQQARTSENKPSIRQRMQQVLQAISKVVPFSRSDIRLLIQAGHRDPIHVDYYHATQLLSPALAFVLAFFLLGFRNSFLLFGIGGLGILLPRFALKRMIQHRHQRIQLALPDALDPRRDARHAGTMQASAAEVISNGLGKCGRES
jgi:Flp pilus assembly protein TadB